MGKPAQVFSLSEFLCEEMVAREWTSADVAQRMGGDFYHTKLEFDLILAITPTEKNVKINDETFSRMGRAFGVSDEFFKGLHSEWLDNPTIRSPFECPDHLFGPDWTRAKFTTA